MRKPRIIVADTDYSYLVPLQAKFVREFFEKIDLEIITDREYFNELFTMPQKADILVVSEEMYTSDLRKHDIDNVFLMTESDSYEDTNELNVDRIYKYTSIKEIFHEVTGKSAEALNLTDSSKREPQIVLVCSACGGVGKTTVAQGISASLTQNYKNVLYINAEHMHTFQHNLSNQGPVADMGVYVKLQDKNTDAYAAVKHVIRKEVFNYLPPFKAALMSLGMDYSVYRQIALAAKQSKDYDFIVIDTDTVFDEYKAQLIADADKIVVVTDQSSRAVNATNTLFSNINGGNSEKFIVICNDFSKEESNAFMSPEISSKVKPNEYIERFDGAGDIGFKELAAVSGIQKTAFLIM